MTKKNSKYAGGLWYPSVICQKCAEAGKGTTNPPLKYGVATFYEATCGVCLERKTCTEPRDYGGFSNKELDILEKINSRATAMRAEFICEFCAYMCGGEWPEGHIGSFIKTECDICGEKTLCCSPLDYVWSAVDKICH